MGYRFEAGKRFVHKKSLKSFRDKVRTKTKRSRSGNIEEIIADLSPSLRGWFEYFKHAYKTTFNEVGLWRINPYDETVNWRAVCDRIASTVRREGRLLPYSIQKDNLSHLLIEWSVKAFSTL